MDDVDAIYITGWGPHTRMMLKRLAGRRVVYWANSFGWGYVPPPAVPILAASRFTMGLWGEVAPASPIFLLPNPVMDEFADDGRERDIDILHLGRKSSRYLGDRLLPALRDRGHVVEEVRGHVADLADLYKRSKVYLYDSRDHWVKFGVSEGFGLQPVEAMACGCWVFSSVNAGLSDVLDPGLNAEKIGVYSLQADVRRIEQRINRPPPSQAAYIEQYRPTAITSRWFQLEPLLLDHFADVATMPPDIVHPSVSERRYAVRRPSVRGRVSTRLRSAVSRISLL